MRFFYSFNRLFNLAPLVFIMSFINGWAQMPSTEQVFVTGNVIFADGQKHKLNYAYNINESILQVQYGNQIKAYGANQVKSFWYYDPHRKLERNFATYPFAIYSDMPTPTFFEVQLQGEPLTLLTREYYVIENVPQFDAFTNRTVYTTRQRLKVDFFFRNTDGEIIKFYGNKKHLLIIMAKQKGQIKDLIKENNFKLHAKNHMVQITAYYNRLQNKK